MARILLAESDRRIRAFLAGILSDFGHDVVACADGVEAGARLAARPVDLVVTDLTLGEDGHPGLIGDCLARGIPTITLTGRRFGGSQTVGPKPLPLLERPFRVADLRHFLDAVAAHAGAEDTRGPRRRRRKRAPCDLRSSTK